MVSSLLKCSDNPEKIAAIRVQGLPVDDFLIASCSEAFEVLHWHCGIPGHSEVLRESLPVANTDTEYSHTG
jgi:hypothetical protein